MKKSTLMRLAVFSALVVAACLEGGLFVVRAFASWN